MTKTDTLLYQLITYMIEIKNIWKTGDKIGYNIELKSVNYT